MKAESHGVCSVDLTSFLREARCFRRASEHLFGQCMCSSVSHSQTRVAVEGFLSENCPSRDSSEYYTCSGRTHLVVYMCVCERENEKEKEVIY